MSRRARFPVCGALDGASGVRKGTVFIERGTAFSSLVHVRPFRKRRTYTMPLSDVADMICRRIILAELAERRAAKAKKRTTRKLVPRRRP